MLDSSTASSRIPSLSPAVHDIFAKPLIVGASVSAGLLAKSPGRRAALNYTSDENIRTVARNGLPGRISLGQLRNEDINDRSIIIGIDTMFWDSLLPNPEFSLRALDRVLLNTRDDAYVVLGDIPMLIPGLQASRDALNAGIRARCTNDPRCRLLPLDQIYRDLLANGYIEFKNQKYTLKELVPDGLHVADTASAYLADKIIKLL